MTFSYHLYGLRIESDIELPEVMGSAVRELNDDPVSIEIGRLPTDLAGGKRLSKQFQHSRSAALYSFDGIGAFLVERGRRIVVDPAKEVLLGDLRAFLLGGVIGTLLHQRRLVPLHISAVATPAGVVAFTGASGAGKSTTAGMINQALGWPLVCDDMAVVRMVGEEPVLSAGLSRLKLWEDALHDLGMEEAGLHRDVMRHGKFHLSKPDLFVPDEVVLSHLIELDYGDATAMQSRSGLVSFVSVANAVYRPFLADLYGDRLELTEKCADISKRIRVWKLPREKNRFDKLVKILYDHFGGRASDDESKMPNDL